MQYHIVNLSIKREMYTWKNLTELSPVNSNFMLVNESDENALTRLDENRMIVNHQIEDYIMALD